MNTSSPKSPRSLTLAATLALLAAPAASAALIAYESFDNAPANDITGTRGLSSTGFLASGTGSTWTLMSGSGDNAGDSIVSPGLSHPGLGTGGNHAQVIGDATGSTFFYRNLAANSLTYAANSTTTTWASFLIQANNSAVGGQVAQIGFFSMANPLTSSASAFTFGAIGGSGLYRASARPIDASTTQTVLTASNVAGHGANNLAFVVIKFENDTNPGAPDFLTAWINPNLANFTGTEASLGNTSITRSSLGNVGVNALNSIGFGTSYTAAQTFRMDEIRLGSDISAITAIPEPSAFAALAGLGALGLAATRRRRP